MKKPILPIKSDYNWKQIHLGEFKKDYDKYIEDCKRYNQLKDN